MAILLAFLAWSAWVASIVYDFTDPAARLELRYDSQFIADLFTRLPIGWPRVVAAAVFVLSALGLGHLALRPLQLRFQGAGERVLLEVGVGLMVWTWITLGLGSVGLLRVVPFRVVLTLGVAAAVWATVRWARKVRAQAVAGGAPGETERRGSGGLLLLEAAVWALLALVLYIALLGALGPEAQFDGRWYHLAQVKHYLERGALYNMVAETRIAVTGLPAYHQLLLTAVAASFNLHVAKLFPWFELVLAVGMLVCIGKHHFGSRQLGVVAALVFASTPLVGWFATTSANDLAVIVFFLGALHVYLRWREDPGAEWGPLFVLGALCGFAAGVKPFALSFTALIGLSVMVASFVRGKGEGESGRRWRAAGRSAAVMGAGAVLAVTPWLIRSWATTGNPTFPFLDGVVFDSPYWNDTVKDYYHWAVRQYGVEPTLEWFVKLPILTVTRADAHRALIGPLFLLLLPVGGIAAIIARGASGWLVRRLVLWSGVLVALWFAAGLHETRYVAFVLPLLALVIAYVVVEHRWAGRAGALLSAVLALAFFVVTVLNLKPFIPFHVHGLAPQVAGRTFVPWEVLYRGVAEDRVMLDRLPMIQYLNRHLAPGRDKVYDGSGQLVPFYLHSDIELFNGGMWDGPTGLKQWDLASPEAPEEMTRVGITHVVVAGTAWPPTRLKAAAVGAFLRPLWEAADGQVLYRFEADGDQVGWSRGSLPRDPSVAFSGDLVFFDDFERGSTGAWPRRVP